MPELEQQAVLPAIDSIPVNTASFGESLRVWAEPPRPEPAAVVDGDSATTWQTTLKQESAGLADALSRLKGSGWSSDALRITRSLTTKDSMLMGESGIISALHGLEVYDAASPLDSMQFRYGKYLDARASESEKKFGVIRVSPWSAECRVMPGSDSSPKAILLTVYDHLLRDPASGAPEKVLERRIIPENERDLAALQKELFTAFEQRRVRYTEQLAAIAPSIGVPLTIEKVEGGPALDSATQANLRKLYSAAGVVVDAFPQKGEIDRTHSGFDLKELGLDTQIEQPLRINGQINQIIISRTEPLESVQKSLAGEVTLINGKSATESYQDRYGNVIITLRARLLSGEPGQSKCTEGILIVPPIKLSPDASSESVPLSVDLTRLGYGELHSAFYAQTMPMLDQTEGPPIYSNLEPNQARANFGSQFAVMRGGAAKIEQLMGLAPGTTVTSILLVDSKRPNAFYSDRNPHMIAVQDEILHQKELGVLPAQHETLHLIDALCGRKLSGGKFAELFAKIQDENPTFFKHLNESTFFDLDSAAADPALSSERIRAGHAQDNSGEFFASLLNSTTHPEWENKIRSESPQFRANYLNALLEVRLNLLRAPEIKDSAPILDDLGNKILFLTDLNKTQSVGVR